MPKFRWGILGTGTIAGKFAEGLAATDDALPVAVGSRSRASAERFGQAFGIEHRHDSYEGLANDPAVDAVYVATPHSLHRENTLACLRAGKHVLCEKPFAINAGEADDMVLCARDNGRFLMEAMWTRFNPVTKRVRERIASGAIGEPRMLACDFGFRTDFDRKSRLFDPRLGGGALLDVGVYCVSYAHMLFGGPPEVITGTAQLGTTGVDEQSAWLFRYGGGELAVMSAAVRTNTPQEAVVTGTESRLRVPRFWCPDRLFVGKSEERFEIAGNGYHYQALEVARCVRAGKLESEVMPLGESLDVMRSLDRIRAQWGLVYPMEG